MRRAIAAVGRTLVTVGLLILLFVVYQLWGTNILEARAQDKLENDFEDLLSESVGPTTTTPTTDDSPVTTATTGPTTTTTLAPLPEFQPNDLVGRIEIPKIGVDKIFVQGTSVDNLKKGPGHYPTTPLPGSLGNAAIAGHRTTYGAPFNRLDELAAGDEIIITLPNGGRYVYKVRLFALAPYADRGVPFTVAPTDTSVVATTDFEHASLTLTSCHPEYSARQRIIVQADLEIEQSPPPVEFDPETLPEPSVDDELPGADPQALEDSLQGEHHSLGPAYGWGAVVMLIGAAWWWLFRRWRHPFTWLAGVGPFLVFLFVFYVFLERALPAGY